MDRLSLLPDEVLGHILSFLPSKHAASTSLLSHRWRNVFVLVPSLNLDYVLDETTQYRHDHSQDFMGFVESLLIRRGKSPVKKFALKIHLPHLFGIDPSRVHYWICNVLGLGGLVDLDLFITFQGERHHVPLLIFKSKTLVKLRLGRGFKIKLSHQDVYLPMLKTLCLDTVDLEGGHDVLETLLPRCPLLEELVLDDMRWKTKCVSVSSQSLKRLRIRFFNVSIISLDVPNLVYLELSCIFGSKYANVNLDSLIKARLNLCVEEQQLRALRRIPRDGFGHLDSAYLMDLITAIRNVKVLHLTSDALELFYYSGKDLPMFDNLVCLSIASDKKHGWQGLPLLIKNSPNLETLIFKVSHDSRLTYPKRHIYRYVYNFVSFIHQGLEHYGTSKCGDACVCSATWEGRPSCLSSSRVKVLEIWGYQGVLRELLQVKHFLEKIPCLELLKLCAVNNIQVPINVQYLLTLPRASSNCKIEAIP